jgi:osmoprotectant transport system permease protein
LVADEFDVIRIWEAFVATDGWRRLLEHVELSFTALLLAGVIGTALGIAASKGGAAGSFLVSSSALVVRMVPTFAAMAIVMALTSIGFRPAVFALTILGVPPVLFNVATGIENADPEAVSAATGIGMTATQRFARVELPLALPFLFTGLRTASVMIVATAALAGAIGAGGLGITIVAGFSNNQDDVLLAGAIPVALLALAFEAALVSTQRVSTPEGLRILQHRSQLLRRQT